MLRGHPLIPSTYEGGEGGEGLLKRGLNGTGEGVGYGLNVDVV